MYVLGCSTSCKTKRRKHYNYSKKNICLTPSNRGSTTYILHTIVKIITWSIARKATVLELGKEMEGDSRFYGLDTRSLNYILYNVYVYCLYLLLINRHLGTTSKFESIE